VKVNIQKRYRYEFPTKAKVVRATPPEEHLEKIAEMLLDSYCKFLEKEVGEENIYAVSVEADFRPWAFVKLHPKKEEK